MADELVSADPTDKLRVPRAKSQRTLIYTDAEADAIVAWALSQEGRRWEVGYVVLATLRYTGLRLMELCSLRLDALDLDAKRLSVIGTGNKPRTVPIPPALAPILRAYLADVRPSLAASPLVFVNPKSHSANRGRYSHATVQLLVQEAALGAGVSGRHFPHRWRHSYATALLRRGVDIHKVQRLLGHANITTTIRYLHLCDADLADAVDQAFPV